MSNKGYALLLVLAGMVCGMLVMSLISSPVSAKLPDEGQETTQPVPVIARSKAVQPVVALPNIMVYPVGTGGKDDQNSYAYIVKDGKLWYCQDTLAREVSFR